MPSTYEHLPVMCSTILDLLAPVLDTPGAVLVDATFGLGGHSLAALQRFSGCTVIGIDRDPQAIALAEQRLSDYAGRFTIHQATYDQIGEILSNGPVDAILFDLGLSSLQIDAVERGFAYAVDAPLSMRMDGDDSALTAADVVNSYSVEQLARILRVYGEESFAGRIARAIVAERELQPFTSSARLAQVVADAIPARQSRTGHPAKRVFQAIRMEVNDERGCLERALPVALDHLALNGRLAVLSYHSGEDRLVKQIFATAQADQVPPGVPVVPEALKAQFQLVTRGALRPDVDEAINNPRSQSARLRVIKRITQTDIQTIKEK